MCTNMQINLHEKMVVGLDDHESMTNWWMDRRKVGMKEEGKEGCWIKLLLRRPLICPAFLCNHVLI